MRKIYYSLTIALSLFIIVSCSTESTPIYQLTTSVEPTEAGTVSPASGEYEEGGQVNVTATANEHWVFDSWQGGQTGSTNPATVTMDSDKNITALFIKRDYPLTVNTEGEGTVSERVVQAKSTDYPYGTTVELTANAADGWEFVEWKGHLTGNESPTKTMIEQDSEVVALFEKKGFEGGNGSLENPYKVSTINQLQSISDNPNAHYIQINDIIANSTSSWNNDKGFMPIGDNVVKFTGTYDGAGFKITGLSINRPNEDYVGLFGYLEGATIENIELVNISVSGTARVGGLAGFFGNGIIKNISVIGEIVGGYYVGGMVGDNSAQIHNSITSGDISGRNRTGGLGGFNDGSIVNSSSKMNISVNNSFSGFSTYFGGLIGINRGTVENSFSIGTVIGNSETGGLIGSNSGSVKKSYATGDVTGKHQTGGLIGINNAQITNSFATGEVSGNNQTGGLIGEHSAKQITNSYALGSVTGDDEVGGLVGQNGGAGEIITSFSVGKIVGTNDVGGLIGLNGAIINSSYWNTESTEQANGIGRGSTDGATGLTTSQMNGSTAQENMPEFDWDEIWMTTNEYPILRWQEN